MLIYEIAKIKAKSKRKSKILSKILKHIYFHKYIPDLYFKEDHILTDIDLTEICEVLYRYNKEVQIDDTTIVSAKLYPIVELHKLLITDNNELSKYKVSIDITKHEIFILYENKSCSITFVVNGSLDDNNVKASANKAIVRFINTALKRAINLFIDEIYFNIL